MKMAYLAFVLIVALSTVAFAQYSGFSDNSGWRSQEQANYQTRQAEEILVRMRNQAQADQWRANTQLREANEAAVRSRQDAEAARWQSQQNSRYSW